MAEYLDPNATENAMDIDTKEQRFDEDIENIIELLEEKSYFKRAHMN